MEDLSRALRHESGVAHIHGRNTIDNVKQRVCNLKDFELLTASQLQVSDLP